MPDDIRIKVELTPAMIDAGATVLMEYELGNDDANEFARWVFEAMMQARNG